MLMDESFSLEKMKIIKLLETREVFYANTIVCLLNWVQDYMITKAIGRLIDGFQA